MKQLGLLEKVHDTLKCFALNNGIAFTDKKNDAHVYELHGLSEEEVKIVEGIE